MNAATNKAPTTNLDDATRAMVGEWLSMHGGDVDGLARWMSRTARIGGIKACRSLIQDATA